VFQIQKRRFSQQIRVLWTTRRQQSRRANTVLYLDRRRRQGQEARAVVRRERVEEAGERSAAQGQMLAAVALVGVVPVGEAVLPILEVA
jgi:hypothetical protein